MTGDYGSNLRLLRRQRQREAAARRRFFSFFFFFQKCAQKGVSGKVRTPTMPLFPPAHPCLLEAPGPSETKGAGSERQQAPTVKGVDGNPIIICRCKQAARFIGHWDWKINDTPIVNSQYRRIVSLWQSYQTWFQVSEQKESIVLYYMTLYNFHSSSFALSSTAGFTLD